jgi:O-antigen/teichoic acid export membrane protein
VLWITGLGWTLLPAIFMIAIFFTLDWRPSDLKGCIKELTVYGLQRVPGDTALAGFLALPAFFTAHMVQDNLVTAGYVAFSMSMLGLAGAAFGPICLLLLPSASKIIVAKDFHLLQQLTNKVAIWTLGLTIAGIAFVLLLAGPIIDLPAYHYCFRSGIYNLYFFAQHTGCVLRQSCEHSEHIHRFRTFSDHCGDYYDVITSCELAALCI